MRRRHTGEEVSMENNFNTVAEEMFSPEQSADDAQAAIDAEELMHDLTGSGDARTAENDGDSGQREQNAPEKAEQGKEDKFSRRMRAALANQKRQLYAELGGSEEEIREILRAHRARKLSEENPKISPEAAKIIVEEREKTQVVQPAAGSEVVAAIQGLIDDGWTREMLTEFVQDETVREQINEEGISVRRAATSYLMRRNVQQKQATKKSVPTLRTATAAGTIDSDRIEEMTDAEFEAFDKRVRAAMANGRKVKL